MAFWIHLLILTGIYSLVVLALQITVGRGGVLFVAPTVFFAIGAYASAILTTTHGWPAWLGLCAGVLLAAMTGLAFGMLSWRLKGDHLILATLGLCEIARSVLNNWDSLTNGSIGIMNIPPIVPWFAPRYHGYVCLAATALALALALVFVFRLRSTAFGLIHAAIHGDEDGTAALGKPVGRTKVLAVAWGAVWAAVAGSLFAHYMSYVDPTTFTVGEAILIFAMLIVGGFGNPWGACAGAALFVLLPEALRLVGIPGHMADPLRRVAFGLGLLVLIRIRPQGLLGKLDAAFP